jgi:hypothetical protein
MATPGFSAAASLYKTSTSYRTDSSAKTVIGSGAVLLQQQPRLLDGFASRPTLCDQARVNQCINFCESRVVRDLEACLAGTPPPLIFICLRNAYLNRRQCYFECSFSEGRCDQDDLCSNGVCCPSGSTGCRDALATRIICCFPNQFCCNGQCCGPNGICRSGACIVCGNLTACNNECIDTQFNEENCGSCGTTCPNTNFACQNGRCVRCPPGLTGCHGECVDTRHSIEHCGTCNNTCLGSQTCVNGVCTPRCTANNPCPRPQVCCAGVCCGVTADQQPIACCEQPSGGFICSPFGTPTCQG